MSCDESQDVQTILAYRALPGESNMGGYLKANGPVVATGLQLGVQGTLRSRC